MYFSGILTWTHGNWTEVCRIVYVYSLRHVTLPVEVCLYLRPLLWITRYKVWIIYQKYFHVFLCCIYRCVGCVDHLPWQTVEIRAMVLIVRCPLLFMIQFEWHNRTKGLSTTQVPRIPALITLGQGSQLYLSKGQNFWADTLGVDTQI